MTRLQSARAYVRGEGELRFWYPPGWQGPSMSSVTFFVLAQAMILELAAEDS